MEVKKTNAGLQTFGLDYLVPVFVMLGIAIMMFVKMAQLSPTPKSDTYATFYSLSNGMGDYYDFKTAWKPRILSNGLSAFTAQVSNWLVAKFSVPIIKTPAELTVAIWTTGWFILLSLAFIWVFKKRSLFYIFGTFAGLSFGYLSRMQMAVRAYPWDMPAVFLFTIFVLLLIKKKYTWIAVLIPFGIGFKETTIILCAAFLFAEIPWKRRLTLLAGSLFAAVAVKVLIDYFVHAPVFFTMETRMNDDAASGLYILENLNNLKSIFPLFINAGTLAVFFLLPAANRNVNYLKFAAVPFVLGNFLFGNMIEYRIWFEMIPFALYALDVNIYGDPLRVTGAIVE